MNRDARERRQADEDGGSWTFLTNHSHVLICLAEDPEAVLRTVALRVGITERAVQRIVRDLESAGVIEREREGRRNRYQIHGERPLRHPVEHHRCVRDLLRLGTAPAEALPTHASTGTRSRASR